MSRENPEKKECACCSNKAIWECPNCGEGFCDDHIPIEDDICPLCAPRLRKIKKEGER